MNQALARGRWPGGTTRRPLSDRDFGLLQEMALSRAETAPATLAGAAAASAPFLTALDDLAASFDDDDDDDDGDDGDDDDDDDDDDDGGGCGGATTSSAARGGRQRRRSFGGVDAPAERERMAPLLLDKGMARAAVGRAAMKHDGSELARRAALREAGGALAGVLVSELRAGRTHETGPLSSLTLTDVRRARADAAVTLLPDVGSCERALRQNRHHLAGKQHAGAEAPREARRRQVGQNLVGLAQQLREYRFDVEDTNTQLMQAEAAAARAAAAAAAAARAQSTHRGGRRATDGDDGDDDDEGDPEGIDVLSSLDAARRDREARAAEAADAPPPPPPPPLPGAPSPLEPTAELVARMKATLHAHLQRVLDLFRQWDGDGDGQITRREFGRALTVLGLAPPKGNGEEAEAAWEAAREAHATAEEKLFDGFDLDGSGELSLPEFERAMRNMRKKVAEVAEEESEEDDEMGILERVAAGHALTARELTQLRLLAPIKRRRRPTTAPPDRRAEQAADLARRRVDAARRFEEEHRRRGPMLKTRPIWPSNRGSKRLIGRGWPKRGLPWA